MPLTSAILLTLALGASPDRILLCRPAVAGDPALARAEALVEAARRLGASYLDYGVACETPGETARAAARAGLGHGVFSTAEGQADGSAFQLVLTTPNEQELARRRVLVPAGADAATPLREALRELERTVPRPPPRWTTPVGWALIGVGAAALVAGAALALDARDEARRADRATSPAAYVAARDRWQSRRTVSGVALGAGGAALAGGLVLRLGF